jgi:prophage antirepressor-like protein
VAKDICKILELDDTSKAISRLDNDEKLLSLLPIAGQNREVLTINESGLYSLINTSRKNSAKRFKKHVNSVILPQIRKTGSYNLQYPQNSKVLILLFFHLKVKKADVFGVSKQAFSK